MALTLNRAPGCGTLVEKHDSDGSSNEQDVDLSRLHRPWRNGETLPMSTTRETYRNFGCMNDDTSYSPVHSTVKESTTGSECHKLAMSAIESAPNLSGRPGFFPDLPRSGLRNSHMGFDRNRVMRHVELKRPEDPWRDGTNLPQATTRETYKKEITAPVRAPAWDVLEGCVLKFSGYFKEHLDETREGNQRRRLCEILYYLEDDTMQVLEPKVDNSGIPQGTLIKRHRIPHPSIPGSILSPDDLRVGDTVTIYGKTFAITSCDAFTRRWYQESGIHQDPNQESVGDVKLGKNHRAEKRIHRGSTNDSSRRIVGRLVRDMSEISLKQFPTNQSKVCRFSAILDDCSKNVFERRKMSILYHLSDDTIELREIYPPRCGRERFTVFLRRSRLLKGKTGTIGPADQVPQPDAFFQLTDFQVGSTVRLADRELFIYAADAFTVNYFRDVLGIELQSPVDVALDDLSLDNSESGYRAPKVQSETRERVELASNRGGRMLIGTPEHKPIAFNSILKEQRPPGVAPRIMIIVFKPSDRSLLINERSVRNSGVSGGRFLQSGVYINELTGKPFELEDFSEGATVCINKHHFTIMGPAYLPTELSERNAACSNSNIKILLQKICDGLAQKLVKAKDMFAIFDEYRNNKLTYKDFQIGMERFGFDITRQEALEIARHFDTNKDGKVDYVEFCTELARLENLLGIQRKQPEAAMLQDENAYGKIALVETEKLEGAKTIQRTVRQLQAIFRQQPRLLHLLTKEFSRRAHGRTVSLEEAIEIFARFGCTLSIPEARAAINFLLPGTKEHSIDYIDLISALKTTYFDLTSPRCP